MIFNRFFLPVTFLAAILASSATAGDTSSIVRIGNIINTDFDVARRPLAQEIQIVLDYAEGLFSFDQEGKPAPGLAERWEQSEDGRTFTFHLRPDARWSDGKPLVAGDFVRAMRYRFDEAIRGRLALWDLIGRIKGAREYTYDRNIPFEEVGIRAIDDQTLEVVLEDRDFYISERLMGPRLLPVPEGWEEMDKSGLHGFPPTSGPYIPVSFVPGKTLVLKKNPFYYDADDVQVETVTYTTYKAQAATNYGGLGLYRAIQDGQIDLAFLAEGEVVDWFKAHSPANVLSIGYSSMNWIEFNMRNPALARPEIRRAMALAIDWDALNLINDAREQTVLRRWFMPVTDDLPPSQITLDPRPYPEKLAEAKRIMADAGYSRDHRLKLVMRMKSQSYALTYTNALAGMWQQIGVETVLVPHQTPDEFYVDFLVPGNFDIALPAWARVSTDLGFYISLAHSDDEVSQGMNFGHYSNPVLDAYIEAANEAGSIEERNDYLVKAEKVLVEDAGKIPLSISHSLALASRDIIETGAGWFGTYPSRYIRVRE